MKVRKYLALLGLKSIIDYIMHQSGRALDGMLCLGQMATLPQDWKAIDGELLAEIEETLATRTGQISFSPQIERLYQDGTREARERFFIVTALCGTIAYDLFFFANALIVGDQFWFSTAIQFGFVTPLSIALIARVRWGKADPNVGAFIVLSAMLGGVLLVLQGLSGEAAHLYIGVVILFVIGANLVLALSLVWALAFTILANICVITAILLHPGMTMNAGLYVFTIMAVGSVYSVIGNYRIDAGVRVAFLHALMERLRADQLALSNQRLEMLADIDGLTGVGNRRCFDKALDRLWTAVPEREHASIALLLIDIDHFKLLNDTHGHLAGDACLRHVARILHAGTGDEHVHLARYGGEEFAVLMAQAGIEEAYGLAETLRLALERQPVVTEAAAQPVSLTVSIGCAAIVPGDQSSTVDLIAAADGALYLAKASGRNRTMTAGLSSLTAPASHARRLAS